MKGKILVSTAYLPPIEYFSIVAHANEIQIEAEENFLKQTYRNRCYILSAHGAQLLTVPVHSLSARKTNIKDVHIDYSKRWQQVHLRAMIASYNSSPFFKYYFENIEKIISKNHKFLLDQNTELTMTILDMLKLENKMAYTSVFEPITDSKNDFRYNISPKVTPLFSVKKYYQVFNNGESFDSNLSILDLIFNMGPAAVDYLK
jgi:WbqC-like protein